MEAAVISSTTCSCGWLPTLSREEVSSTQTEMTRTVTEDVAGINCGRENVRVVPRRAPGIKIFEHAHTMASAQAPSTH